MVVTEFVKMAAFQPSTHPAASPRIARMGVALMLDISP
jgi:hypothetical protein